MHVVLHFALGTGNSPDRWRARAKLVILMIGADPYGSANPSRVCSTESADEDEE
jgi:hypothetical protein